MTMGLRVLGVEDDADSAETLVMLLGLWGHESRTASDAAEATAAAAEFEPDVILLDIGLPGADGYEVARTLRDAGHDCTLVAMTGYGQVEDKERAHAAGFDHHVTKPADPPLLEKLLAKVAARA
jgi:CheY-like chemotaxis protein